MSKETFKDFVRKNPSLVKYVNNDSMSWQKFYEMFELYGSDNKIWDSYLNRGSISNIDGTFNELINIFKGINLEKVQKGITSIQKTISLVQELGIGSGAAAATSFESRPTYQHFDD